jgi:uncharacterized membrane protein
VTQERHIHIHLDTSDLAKMDRKLDAIIRALGVVQAQEAKEVAALDQITADVQANTDTVQSAISLITNLAQMVRDAGTDPAALEALATQLEENSQSLADAVVRNTPSSPAEPTT